ncbi:MAG: response regulator, partial [Planctomycetota bacterium]
ESLGDTMKSLALRAHTKGLELACRIRPDVPERFLGDAGRLRQIVVNLVGNAVKFTEAGEVVVDVELESQGDEEATLHFAVTDTGIGVPSEKQAVIFDAFEQADNSTTRRFGGSGLGLAISTRLVEVMGGRIWVQSEVDRGSTFHFTACFGLPRGEAARAAPRKPAIVQDTRVLVVDDNATNRRILQEMLQNWGMRPSVVGGAREALSLLRQTYQAGEPYELVLTDANMPEVDGFALVKHIRKDPELSSTIIMMLTSGDRPGDISRCEQLGVAAYLLKPIKQSELFDAIVMALGIAAPEDEGREGLAAEEPKRLRPLRVLLAEDSLVNQKLAVALLERHGHTVAVANHGREAIAALAVQDFDLVLMDVQMPEMDGLEATAVIRAREKQTGRHVAIIAMTAHAMKGDRQRCLEAGMDEYIAKPIRASVVFNTIEAVLGTPVAERTPRDPKSAGETPLPEAVEGGPDWPAALESFKGDRALLKTVVEASLEESPRLMAAIREAIDAGDATALRLAAHTLRGSLRYFGESAAYEQASRLEMMAEDGNLSLAEETWAALDGQMRRFTPILLDYVRRDEAGDES